jgi:hypothetical protein
MGEGLGSFEVSAFPGGNGFFIQHESGERLVTTLIDDQGGARGPETFVLVYSAAGPNPSDRRSVVMADLKGNSYSCVVQLIKTDARVREPNTCSAAEGADYINDDTGTAVSETIAEFPCAPALFGPTHVSNLEKVEGLLVQATPQSPILGEEYGCGPPSLSKKKMKNSDKSVSSVPGEDSGSSPFENIASIEREPVCVNKMISIVHRGICTFQEKSLHQKATANADGVIVINTEDDELFVMSGGFMTDDGSIEKLDDSNFPATVLVTGNDGQKILDAIGSFEADGYSQLHAQISLMRDEPRVSTLNDGGFAVAGNKFWPAVRASPQVLQIFTPSGWGVHAFQQPFKGNGGELEWKLYVMKHGNQDL